MTHSKRDKANKGKGSSSQTKGPNDEAKAKAKEAKDNKALDEAIAANNLGRIKDLHTKLIKQMEKVQFKAGGGSSSSRVDPWEKAQKEFSKLEEWADTESNLLTEGAKPLRWRDLTVMKKTWDTFVLREQSNKHIEHTKGDVPGPIDKKYKSWCLHKSLKVGNKDNKKTANECLDDLSFFAYYFYKRLHPRFKECDPVEEKQTGASNLNLRSYINNFSFLIRFAEDPETMDKLDRPGSQVVVVAPRGADEAHLDRLAVQSVLAMGGTSAMKGLGVIDEGLGWEAGLNALQNQAKKEEEIQEKERKEPKWKGKGKEPHHNQAGRSASLSKHDNSFNIQKRLSGILSPRKQKIYRMEQANGVGW